MTETNPMKLYFLKIKDFYSNLNNEDITEADYTHTKRVCKDFETKEIVEYHDLYVQSNINCSMIYSKTFAICTLKNMKQALLILLKNENNKQTKNKKTKRKKTNKTR